MTIKKSENFDQNCVTHFSHFTHTNSLLWFIIKHYMWLCFQTCWQLQHSYNYLFIFILSNQALSYHSNEFHNYLLDENVPLPKTHKNVSHLSSSNLIDDISIIVTLIDYNFIFSLVEKIIQNRVVTTCYANFFLQITNLKKYRTCVYWIHQLYRLKCNIQYQ